MRFRTKRDALAYKRAQRPKAYRVRLEAVPTQYFDNDMSKFVPCWTVKLRDTRHVR